MEQNLRIPYIGSLEIKKGTKRVVAFRDYCGDKEIFCVIYWDENYDKIAHTKGVCCQPPTRAKTEKGAIRKINQFFNAR